MFSKPDLGLIAVYVVFLVLFAVGIFIPYVAIVPIVGILLLYIYNKIPFPSKRT
ncbi:MAG: hypothetical protein JJT94_06435 [Bernardetiaceae bacterium]|nr:hypothetical protein [Bernardetiaceae bacterium]